MLLDAGVPLSFITRAGKLRGRLAPPLPKNLPLRHAQYDRARDRDFCLKVARSIAQGKLRNALSLLRRLCRSHPECNTADMAPLERSLSRLRQATTLGQIRGLEGVAGRAYFRLYRQALRPDMTFTRRSRRPPKDPANALLSLGYTLLTQNLITACEMVALDPFDGFFHADKYGRPALALDLVEEFRAVIVDSVVRLVINRRMVTPKDFSPASDGGTYLSSRSLRRFLRQYAARLNTPIMHPRVGRRLSYQRIFEVQARILAKYIQGELDAYIPFRVR